MLLRAGTTALGVFERSDVAGHGMVYQAPPTIRESSGPTGAAGECQSQAPKQSSRHSKFDSKRGVRNRRSANAMRDRSDTPAN